MYIDSTRQREGTEVAAVDLAQTVEIEILHGRQEKTEQKIAGLLNAYLLMMAQQKAALNISNQEITRDILKSKEKEKVKITKRLGELSQDSRNVEIIMKNHRLGKWNLGQTRALYEYDEEQYDKERTSIEDDALVEMRLHNVDGVTERTRQIYKIAALEEKHEADLQAAESNALLRAMPDDDDFGERDGDENY